MRRFLMICLCLFSYKASAQFTYRQHDEIAVRDEENTLLEFPWAGGLNAAQYNTMDLNADNKDDLVLFDRTSNSIVTFISDGTRYSHAPEYESVFPNDITNFVILRDYNCDGLKDIFTRHTLGIKVYTNVSDNNGIAWQHFTFYTGSTTESQVLLTKGFSGKTNLQLQYDDLPALTDADGDGDLDVYNPKFGNPLYIEFHKNYSVERYGTCDSLDFERITDTWGNFMACHCEHFSFDDPPACSSGGRTKHAIGKALLVLDVNNDSKKDLILSGSECTALSLLPNTGSSENGDVNSFSAFPDDTPVEFKLFPAAYYEDVDFDGKKDLISAPNISVKDHSYINLQQTNWLFKNTGSNDNPAFIFVQKDFLQDQMIDAGDNAIPAFADLEGDGDLDLFISNNSSPDGISRIVLYENTGSKTDPEFKFKDGDYLDFSQRTFFNLKISFNDINNDKRNDLVFSATATTDQITRLYYISNGGNFGLDFSGATATPVTFTLTSPENISFVDVDQDGASDILAGRSGGKLEYWKNNSDKGALAFTLADNDFLRAGSAVESFSVKCTAADLDADGKTDLVCGDQTGILKLISDFREETNRSMKLTDIVFDPLSEIYRHRNLGGRVWPTVANLFHADKPSIVVGTVLGGIKILRHDDEQPLRIDPVVEVYPNPHDRDELLKVRSNIPIVLQVFNLLGQAVTEPELIAADSLATTSVSFLSPGLYLLKFTGPQNQILVRRIVVY